MSPDSTTHATVCPIANETEFQEWLASVLESERQRLREEAARISAPNEFRGRKEK